MEIIITDKQKGEIWIILKQSRTEMGVPDKISDADIHNAVKEPIIKPEQWNSNPVQPAIEWLRREHDILYERERKQAIYFDKVPDTVCFFPRLNDGKAPLKVSGKLRFLKLKKNAVATLYKKSVWYKKAFWHKKSFTDECLIRGSYSAESWNKGSVTKPPKDRAGVAGTRKALRQYRESVGELLRESANFDNQLAIIKSSLFWLFTLLKRLRVDIYKLSLDTLLKLIDRIFPVLGLTNNLGKAELNTYLTDYMNYKKSIRKKPRASHKLQQLTKSRLKKSKQ